VELPDLAALRRSYEVAGLLEEAMAGDPYTQFARWFAEAVEAGLAEPNAMVLATADADGRPSARTVLLKGVDASGFRFFTNAGSRKGRDLTANPHAALCFPWHAMERQVVVTGDAAALPREESAAYFASRPYASQLGALASDQFSVLPGGRAQLDAQYASAAAAYPEGVEVPLPPTWGGWLVAPVTVDFWQGRAGRLHDRLRYRRNGGDWVLERLSP
jgi:pyridoxamine 5'-phosphate oxidase